MNEEEIKLLNEMKDNCLKQANYIDVKAMDKYHLLRKLEEGYKQLNDKIKSLNKGLEKARTRRDKYKRKYLKEKHINKTYVNIITEIIKYTDTIKQFYWVEDDEPKYVSEDLLSIIKGGL